VPPRFFTRKYFLAGGNTGDTEYARSKGMELDSRLRTALDLANPNEGETILDIGCGRGEIVLHCGLRGALSIGVDYAPTAIAITRETIEERTVLEKTFICRADAKALPFKSAIFDRIFLLDVIEHLNPHELEACMDEVSRVVAPMGRVIIHTDNSWYMLFFDRIARSLSYLRYGERVIDSYEFMHVNYQSPSSLRRLLKKKGFECDVWVTRPSSVDEFFRQVRIDVLIHMKSIIRIIMNLIVRTPLFMMLSPTIWSVARRR